MHVAGLRVRPGVEDRDDRAALPLLRRVTHLHGARAMAKGAQIVGRKPARAAELVGALFLVDHVGTTWWDGLSEAIPIAVLDVVMGFAKRSTHPTDLAIMIVCPIFARCCARWYGRSGSRRRGRSRLRSAARRTRPEYPTGC